jgi:hypothetical protein
VVIFSWTSHAVMASFSLTCPKSCEAIVPGSSRYETVIFFSTCPESGEAIVPGSSHTSGGSCAARDDLPVTEGEYYTALVVYPAIGTCYVLYEAVESEHCFALQLFAVVRRTHAPVQSQELDHF